MSDDITIDRALVQRVAAAWPKRATIRSDMVTIESAVEYDEERPDYPLHLLPFHEHPEFLAIEPEQRDQVLTWSWVVYNQRVISAEEPWRTRPSASSCRGCSQARTTSPSGAPSSRPSSTSTGTPTCI